MLSSPSPDPSVARDYLHFLRNPGKPASTLTWKDILDEEPFEGQHWEGVYGLPPGSTVEGWETMSVESTPPLSPLSYIDDRSVSPTGFELEDETGIFETGYTELISKPDTLSPTRLLFDHRQDLEMLQAKQYWRKEWRIDSSLAKTLDLGDPSSLGPHSLQCLSLSF